MHLESLQLACFGKKNCNIFKSFEPLNTVYGVSPGIKIFAAWISSISLFWQKKLQFFQVILTTWTQFMAPKIQLRDLHLESLQLAFFGKNNCNFFKSFEPLHAVYCALNPIKRFASGISSISLFWQKKLQYFQVIWTLEHSLWCLTWYKNICSLNLIN